MKLRIPGFLACRTPRAATISMVALHLAMVLGLLGGGECDHHRAHAGVDPAAAEVHPHAHSGSPDCDSHAPDAHHPHHQDQEPHTCECIGDCHASSSAAAPATATGSLVPASHADPWTRSTAEGFVPLRSAHMLPFALGPPVSA